MERARLWFQRREESENNRERVFAKAKPSFIARMRSYSPFKYHWPRRHEIKPLDRVRFIFSSHAPATKIVYNLLCGVCHDQTWFVFPLVTVSYWKHFRNYGIIQRRIHREPTIYYVDIWFGKQPEKSSEGWIDLIRTYCNCPPLSQLIKYIDKHRINCLSHVVPSDRLTQLFSNINKSLTLKMKQKKPDPSIWPIKVPNYGWVPLLQIQYSDQPFPYDAD